MAELNKSRCSIPVVLFAYARPDLLSRTLASLKLNEVKVLYVYSDGAAQDDVVGRVAEVRRLVRAIDWCEVRAIERGENWGLGRNVLSGVSEVASMHEAFVVWEDDLVAVPGTYAWLSRALQKYREHERVMSVTAWNHPRVIPSSVGNRPYFDGRAECWVWGAYSRSWLGMVEKTAEQKMRIVRQNRDVGYYGADLPAMAKQEKSKNIWAVRWLYHHMEHGGLCLRPPWSAVEHLGFDPRSTNAGAATDWVNPPLKSPLPIPEAWPEALEHPECARLWRKANPGGMRFWWRKARAKLQQLR